MKPFVDISDGWTKDLEQHTHLIKKEILKALSEGMFKDGELWKSSYPELVSSEIKNEWKTSVFKFFGINRIEVQKMFPETQAALSLIPNLISAEISFLYPDVKIKPHKGYSKLILRNHLPISVPDGDTGLKVSGEIHQWKEGELVSFNDSLEHEAWNLTDQIRIVLMFDIAQPTGEYSVEEICKYKLERLDDPALLEYGSKEDWLVWLDQGYFPTTH